MNSQNNFNNFGNVPNAAAGAQMPPRPPLQRPPPPLNNNFASAPASTAQSNFATSPQSNFASAPASTPQRPPMPQPMQMPQSAMTRPPIAAPRPAQLPPLQRPAMPQLPPRPVMRPPAQSVHGSPAVSAGKPSPFAQAPPAAAPVNASPSVPSAPVTQRPPMPQAPQMPMRPGMPPRPVAPVAAAAQMPTMRPPPLAPLPSNGPVARPPPMSMPMPMTSPGMPMRPPMPAMNQMRPPALGIPQTPQMPSVNQPPIPQSPMLKSPVIPPMPMRPQQPQMMMRPPMTPQLNGNYQGQGQGPSQVQGYSQPQPQGQVYPQNQPQQQQPMQGYQQAQPHGYHAQSQYQLSQYQQPPPQQLQQPQQQFQQAPPPQQRVNPAAIPSVVAVLEADRERFKDFGPFLTCTHIADHPPPLPATTAHISVIDDGNSAPGFIRCTMNHVPASEELCENSKIPLSLLIQPFASATSNEVPLADLGELGPVRCNRCRAYINPHCQFIKGGRAFICNLCDMANEVPEPYYANLDMNGKRIDLDLRPELKYGTVDFVATKEYMNKTPGKPFLLFGVDTSKAAQGSGATGAALDTISAFLQQERECALYEGVGLMLFDRVITFYTQRPGSSSAEAIVMTDISDPFLPAHHDRLFVPLSVAAGLIHQLKSGILAHSQQTNEASPLCCFGSAVQCAIDAVQGRGGRCLFFLTALPSAGLGALKNRSADPQLSAAVPTDKAPPLLFPQSDFYAKAGKRAAEGGVSVSLCLTPVGYCDLSTLGGCAEFSGGRVFFTSPAKSNAASLQAWLNSQFAFDCLARIRCGSGLQVKKHYGHFTAGSNGHDLSFGCWDAEGSIAALLEYDGKLSERSRIGFQVACLYTHPQSGQRRIRVLNLALPVTAAMPTLFRMAELDSILAFLVKKNISQRLEAPIQAFPASLTAKCVGILAAYRRYCAANMSAGQLILPDSLKLLPILTLATIKDSAFYTLPIGPDARAQASLHLMSTGIGHYLEHFYPSLYPIDLTDSSTSATALPACLRLSREHLKRDGVYLLCNGHEIVLYCGDAVPGALLQAIFAQGLLNACHLQPDSQLPVLNNESSSRLREAVNALRSLYSTALPLRLIRQSVDVAEEAEWTHWLVEDASPTGPSYVDYLCRVHAQIQQVIAQGTTLSLAERTSMLNFFH